MKYWIRYSSEKYKIKDSTGSCLVLHKKFPFSIKTDCEIKNSSKYSLLISRFLLKLHKEFDKNRRYNYYYKIHSQK